MRPRFFICAPLFLVLCDCRTESSIDAEVFDAPAPPSAMSDEPPAASEMDAPLRPLMVRYDCSSFARAVGENAGGDVALRRSVAAARGLLARHEALRSTDQHAERERVGRALGRAVEDLSAGATSDDVEARVLAQNVAFRIGLAFTTYGTSKEEPPIPMREIAALVAASRQAVWALALPVSELDALGADLDEEPSSFLGDALVARKSAQCGDGVLFHERVFAGAFAFRPVRGAVAKGLFAHVIAFDTDGGAHMTKLVDHAELRTGLGPKDAACVLERSPERGLEPVAFAALVPDSFIFASQDAPRQIGCLGCHGPDNGVTAEDVLGRAVPELEGKRRRISEDFAAAAFRDLEGAARH